MSPAVEEEVSDSQAGQDVATEDEGVLSTAKFVGDGHVRLEVRGGVEEAVAGAERQEVDEPVI